MMGFSGLLLLMALLVLLIASANIASMLLARSVVRQREVAIRLAIGAGRARIVEHLLAESLVLFLAGGAAGVGLAYLGTSWVERMPLPLGIELGVRLVPDARVLLFALAMTVGFGTLFSLLPALRASRPDLVPSLREGTPGGGTGARGRSAFVTAQVAMSVFLLLAATLTARSLQKALTMEVGFDGDGVVVASTDLEAHGYEAARGRAFYRQLVERVRGLPGVESVGLSQVVLMGGDAYGDDITSPDDNPGSVGRSNARHTIVDPGFFDVMRIELVAGRGFPDADVEGGVPVTVVNETVAERLWPGENPLGKRLRRGGVDHEVVGVSRDGKYTFVGEGPIAFTFRPFAQSYTGTMTLHARAPGATAATLRGIREAVRTLDADVAVEDAVELSEITGLSLLPYRFTAQLMGVFGLTGLLLVAIGLYGVLAFQVAQRTREIGVRRALGAREADLVRQVVSRGARLAAVGCAAGLVFGGASSHVLRSVLLGLQPLDPPTFLGVPVVLFAVALAASWIPALRAARVQATVALRHD
jgi:predicted permease